MNKLFYILTLCTALSPLTSCKSNKPAEIVDDSEINEAFTKDLKTIVPTLKSVEKIFHLTGTVEANPSKVVHFNSLINGVVTQVFFTLGDPVKKGQILAEIKSIDFTSLQSEIKNTDSQLKWAEQNLRSKRSMYNDGIASHADLLEAESQVEILKQNKNKVQSILQLYGASSQKGVFQIKAPSSGTIIDNNIAAGMQLSSEGEALFVVADLSDVWIVADVHSTLIRDIQVGMPVDITTLSYTDQIFKGEINAISQVLDPESKVLKARISLDNSENKLKPGMYVDIDAKRISAKSGYAVPTEAVVFDSNQYFVVLKNKKGKFRVEKIQILYQNNQETYLVNALNDDEEVVVSSALLIYEKIK